MGQPRTQMKLIGFLNAQNCTQYPGSWRHPAAMLDFLTPEHYQRIGRTLEYGKFHMAFVDDRLAIPDIYGDSYAETVSSGIRAIKLDPISVVTLMGAATSRLGLGATYSTTYYEPFHVARVFATLDLLSAGRAAWNVVTSLNDSEAANFGKDEHSAHDLRYDRADEFLEVVLGHWDTWEDDAIAMRPAENRFADPTKVHRLQHVGKWFRSRGPFTVPRSPQGRPVIIQAGQSGRGQNFAARWGEVIFALFPNVESGRKQYEELKTLAAASGRNPQHLVIAQACNVFVGETAQAAEDKKSLVDSLAKPIDALVLLSESLNFDFAKKGAEEPFTTEELASISGMQSMRNRVVAVSGKANPTVNDFVRFSGRGTIREYPIFTGTPQRVADLMEEWFTKKACDGFVVAATHVPGAHEDFVRLVVPELQRRGLFRKEYEGSNLRENLGLPKAIRGDWRLSGRGEDSARTGR